VQKEKKNTWKRPNTEAQKSERRQIHISLSDIVEQIIINTMVRIKQGFIRQLGVEANGKVYYIILPSHLYFFMNHTNPHKEKIRNTQIQPKKLKSKTKQNYS